MKKHQYLYKIILDTKNLLSKYSVSYACTLSKKPHELF